MRYRITAPVKGVNSTVAGVTFADSVVVVDEDTQRGALNYFLRHGYQVEEIPPDPEPEPEAPQTPEAPKKPTKSSKHAEWVAYAVTQGMPEAEAAAMTIAALAERYADKEGADL